MEMNKEVKGITESSAIFPVDKCTTNPSKDSLSAETAQKTSTDNHELLSDGSASAFEGTEFRDNYDREQEKKLREQKKKNYPSGLSDY